MNRNDEDFDNSVPPPSYEEALKDLTHTSSQAHSSSVPNPPLPSRPQSSSNHPPPSSHRPPPNRPSSSTKPQAVYLSHSSSTHSQTVETTQSSSLYTNNPGLPFEYPRGHFCNKCKNTGYKVRNGKPCLQCWKLFFSGKSYNPNPNLPFKYPKGHYCHKCKNTGWLRAKNKSCGQCYFDFCPRNSPAHPMANAHGWGPQTFATSQGSNVHVYTSGGFSGFSGFMGSAPPAPFMQPVAPGDPRLGGVICGRCRGSGTVTFFLDQDLCPVCHGVGRILNVPR